MKVARSLRRRAQALAQPVGVVEDADAAGALAREEHARRARQARRVQEVGHDGVEAEMAGKGEAHEVLAALPAHVRVARAVRDEDVRPVGERVRRVGGEHVVRILLRRRPVGRRAEALLRALPAVDRLDAEPAALEPDYGVIARALAKVVARRRAVEAARADIVNERNKSYPDRALTALKA